MNTKRYLTLLMVLLLLFSGVMTPWDSVYGSAVHSNAETKDKINLQWIPHNYRINGTGKPIVRKTTVDYTTGLFTNEDTVLDFIDTSSKYYFKSISGMNTKKPLITYAILKSGTIEILLKYDSQKKVVTTLANRNINDGIIDEVYPDAGMYVVEKGRREYLVYSLATNKLIHKAKEPPMEHSNIFVTNYLYHNYFDPELSIGALYVEAGKYYDPKKNGYVSYPGEYPYEIRPNGKIVKLHTTRENASDDYVDKRKLNDKVVLLQTKAKRKFKHELIINGKKKTIFETDASRPNYAFAVAQSSPNGKYVVLWVNFIENNRSVKGKEEYQIFDTQTGKRVQTIPINTTGSSSAIDFGVSWMAGTDHIFQSGLLNHGAYRVIGTDLMTPRRYGNVVDDFTEPYYSFSLNDYLSINDPIPVSFEGKYMQYSNQGTFRHTDLTTYTPVSELISLLGGKMSNKNGKITLTYQEKSYNLDPKKQIVWKNRTYYPIRDILTGLGLKLLTESNKLASEEWRELQIVK
ncbi:hypothetical protein [Paenibacillus illinoisensis]|uniref:hypothetical protein n=1 Tax=Paenibacillus illinoisensis TaxID=59845 RepID=UPI003D995674